MSRLVFFTLAPLWLFLGGCTILPEPVTSTSWMKRPSPQTLEENVVQLEDRKSVV